MKNAQNPAPNVFQTFTLSDADLFERQQREKDPAAFDEIDALQIFDIIRNINDPEYPLTLEQLNVVNIARCSVDRDIVTVRVTPTIPHCSMAQLIGLMVKTKLRRSLPSRMKVEVVITEGMHVNELDINKQLRDKERVAAALQNNSITRVIRKGVINTDKVPAFFQNLV